MNCGSPGAFRLRDSADASFCLWVHDRHMIRVWTAQGLHAMVMWHITLHAQWRYRHTTWNALDLNARPRGSYHRINFVYDSAPKHIHDNLQSIAGRGPRHERGIRHVPSLRRIHCEPSAPHEYRVATHGQVNWRSQQNQPLRASIAGPLGHC